jgi:hypothetical protein
MTWAPSAFRKSASFSRLTAASADTMMTWAICVAVAIGVAACCQRSHTPVSSRTIAASSPLWRSPASGSRRVRQAMSHPTGDPGTGHDRFSGIRHLHVRAIQER